MFIRVIFGLLVLAAVQVSALPLWFGIRRAILPHAAVVGFPETVPASITGTLMLKYKPWLHVINGCVPFRKFQLPQHYKLQLT